MRFKFLILPYIIPIIMQAAPNTTQPVDSLSKSTPNSERYLLPIGNDTLSFRSFSEYLDAKIAEEMYAHSEYEELPINSTFRDTIIFNKIFLPLVFKANIIDKNIKIFRATPPQKNPLSLHLQQNESLLTKSVRQDSIHNALRYALAIRIPELTSYTEEMLNDAPKFDPNKHVNNESLTEITIPSEFNSITRQPSLTVQTLQIKPRKWTFISTINAHFANNYISDNWYQGGEINTTLNSNIYAKVKYDDFAKTIFETEIDWRLGFYNTPKDTVNAFRINEDQFRLISKFGYKAFNKFYYSASFEFKTKLFDAYPSNTKDIAKRTASFLSPAETYLGMGIEYKNNFAKARIENMNVYLSPVTYTHKYRRDIAIPVSGIEKDKHKFATFGSMIRTNLRWKLMYNLYWDTRLYYFTSYSNVEAEWENTIMYAFSRFFSTKVFFIIRYDDKRKLTLPNDSYFQLKEYISLGFSYRFNP